jgi:uncharacterized membrane protein YphA (DoxX/SURF4 family)
MASRSVERAFVVLWWTTGILLFVWSVETLHQALGAGHAHPHLALLGLVEAIAAVLFLVPRTLRVGAVGLLLTFAVAFAAHGARGELRLDLLLYAAVVSFVLVHGPVPVSRPLSPR